MTPAAAAATPQWAVLLTTHNRVDVTRECLEALARQDEHEVGLTVVVCDAGSTDGTPEMITEVWPEAIVLHGDRSLFWAAGMRTAWEHATTLRPDAYLWLNDDTILDTDAISRLARHARDSGEILVGATRDPDTGEITYSGVRRTDRRRPLKWDRVAPADHTQRVETMNGNCVLVGASVVDEIGLLDPVFEHGMGDFDYGLRARRAGREVVLLPGTIGTCAANPERAVRATRDEWRSMRSTKDLPPAQWFTFARRWAGPLWPVYGVAPYVRRLARSLRGSSSTDR